MDPSKLLVAKSLNTIKKEYATYVQVIHTSKIAGQWNAMGDIDIYVHFQPESSFLRAIDDKHSLSFFIHVATATKRLYLIAEQNGKRTGRVIPSDEEESLPRPKAKECLIGVYATQNSGGGKYWISLKNQSDIFWKALGELSNDRIFFEQAIYDYTLV